MDSTVTVKIVCLIIVASFFGLVACQPSGNESYQSDLIKSLFRDNNYWEFGHYSGYLEAGNRTFLHYWFIRARNPNWERCPLIVWFHGGPGSSSVSAGLSKFGAILLKDDLTIDASNPYYMYKANVLYFDTPAGVGFSYQLDPKDSDFNAARTANYNYAAIRNFFDKFYFLKNNNFYLIGSNNASFHASLLGVKLAENKFIPNFKGVLYINSIFNKTERNFATLAHGNKLGRFAKSDWARFVESCCPPTFTSVRECYHEKNFLHSKSPCSYACKILFRESHSDNIKHVMQLSENETIYQNAKEAWFQKESTMKSLNIREFSNSKWKETNDTISSKFEHISVSNEVRLLLENEIPVTIVYGDSDLITSYYNGLWLLENLGDRLKLQSNKPCYCMFCIHDEKQVCDRGRYIYTNMANRKTNVSLIVFRDVGHDFYVDQFDIFVDLIISFIFS